MTISATILLIAGLAAVWCIERLYFYLKVAPAKDAERLMRPPIRPPTPPREEEKPEPTRSEPDIERYRPQRRERYPSVSRPK